jgi:hypothetical protein
LKALVSLVPLDALETAAPLTPLIALESAEPLESLVPLRAGLPLEPLTPLIALDSTEPLEPLVPLRAGLPLEPLAPLDAGCALHALRPDNSLVTLAPLWPGLTLEPLVSLGPLGTCHSLEPLVSLHSLGSLWPGNLGQDPTVPLVLAELSRERNGFDPDDLATGDTRIEGLGRNGRRLGRGGTGLDAHAQARGDDCGPESQRGIANTLAPSGWGVATRGVLGHLGSLASRARAQLLKVRVRPSASSTRIGTMQSCAKSPCGDPLFDTCPEVVGTRADRRGNNWICSQVTQCDATPTCQCADVIPP